MTFPIENRSDIRSTAEDPATPNNQDAVNPAAPTTRAQPARAQPRDRAVTGAAVVVGSALVVSVAMAMGSDWVIRGGIAVALAAAVAVTVILSRALRRQRHTSRERLLETARSHNQQLTDERRQSAEVLPP